MEKTITIPNVKLSLEQLIDIVRKLEPEDRTQIAQALLKEDVDQKIDHLLKRLVQKEDSSNISDKEIDDEIRQVRNQNRSL